MNVSLTPELEKFITEKLESGRYSSAEEVIREGLRLLREHEEEQRHLVEACLETNGRDVSTPLPQPANSEKVSRWIEEHRREYMGQVVALDGDRLVAQGTDPRAVYLAARQAGVEVPSLVVVRAEEELPFGGW
jgi:antitoxin ParD1/3/4